MEMHRKTIYHLQLLVLPTFQVVHQSYTVLLPGTEYVFRGYGIACVAVLIAYVALDYFYLRGLGQTATVADPHHLLEETSHLAPCGVPMSLSHNLSSSRLNAMSKGKICWCDDVKYYSQVYRNTSHMT